jgi:hypothetical protein
MTTGCDWYVLDGLNDRVWWHSDEIAASGGGDGDEDGGDGDDDDDDDDAVGQSINQLNQAADCLYQFIFFQVVIATAVKQTEPEIG